MIKYKARHLYPLEIEKILEEHPEIVEAGVFGKPDPLVQVCDSVIKECKASGYTVYLPVNTILRITLHLQMFYIGNWRINKLLLPQSLTKAIVQLGAIS